jgi:long-chain acyl-CoA synthetase
VPTLWHVLVSLLGPSGRQLPAVRMLTNAGAALPPSRVAELQQIFPEAQLFLMYGQTECKRACYLPPEQAARRPDSVGFAIPGTEVTVRRPDGTQTADGETGELWVRGDHVMQGYWSDPDLTARKLLPGRFPGDRVLRTGDLFRRDSEGFLYFVARMDDMITTRGEKVAPLEVERVLCAAPGVCDVAVVGVPDDLLGQRVVAHLTALPGVVLSLRELRVHCAAHLEEYKVPKHLVLHDQLPRLDTGKIDRLALAEAGVR